MEGQEYLQSKSMDSKETIVTKDSQLPTANCSLLTSNFRTILIEMTIYDDIFICFQLNYWVRGFNEETKAIWSLGVTRIFREIILFLRRFLLMNISSRCKKRYIIFWTDKAVLLVLWTCGDVEVNPGPTENTNTRSQVLRRFRRRSQNKILKLIYQNSGQEIPKEIFKYPPPGWDEYKPDVEFGNISNLPKGKTSGLGSKEDQIFRKMLYILQNNTSATLSSEWEILIKDYNKLNSKLEQEKSKKAILRWLDEKELSKMLKKYEEEEENPSEEISKRCLSIAQRKRRRPSDEDKSAPASKTIKKNETDIELAECQGNCDGLNISTPEVNEDYTVDNADLLLTYLGNLFPSESPFNEKDLQHKVSFPKDIVEETQDLSEDVDLPGDTKYNNENSFNANGCDRQQSLLTENITDTETFSEITNDLDELQCTWDLEEYLKRLGNREPSSKMFQLCQDILNRKTSL